MKFEPKLLIKHFGPIKEGYIKDEGYLTFKKVTIFIGPQGSGKSTIAKLFVLYLKYLEHSGRRSILKSENGRDFFLHYFLESFERDFDLKLSKSELITESNKIDFSLDGHFNVTHSKLNKTDLSKTLYIPAERGIFEVLEKNNLIEKINGILGDFIAEYHLSRKEYAEDFSLPFSDAVYYYDKNRGVGKLKGKDFEIDLSKAASGFQAAIPMLLTSEYLNLQINDSKKQTVISPIERQEIEIAVNNIISKFEQGKITEEAKDIMINTYSNRLLKPNHLINIVEEPEINLFPKAQKQVLYKLVEIANSIEDNQLVITTHSPYLINDTTLAIMAWRVAQEAKDNPELLKRIRTIVPEKSWLNPDDVVVYECHTDGTITKLRTFDGMPSDSNMLNQLLNESNEVFDELLDIQDEVKSLKSDAE